MSVLSTEEQALLTWLQSSIPRWFWMNDTTLSNEEMWGAVVKALILVQRQGEDWQLATFIESATDVWLNQHGRDRGTFRQLNETDVAMRSRLRSWEDAVTPGALMTVVQAVLDADGVAGTPYMLELPYNGAHNGVFTSSSGVGGTFTQQATNQKFEPDDGWTDGVPPYQVSTRQPGQITKLVFTGAASAANDGTRTITGLELNKAVFNNATGVEEADPTVAWTLQRFDLEGNLRDGFARAYSQRGYRSARLNPQFIVVILPFGTTAETAASVTEALRLKKAGGFGLIVERRTIAP